ncbi:MAG: hypothetical protein C4B58_00045 [Deltaproteobacteria bacterium]|nr:MAG: hypothetical protein C4B58_00045 [Deltaproteobacteria bacterium]
MRSRHRFLVGFSGIAMLFFSVIVLFMPSSAYSLCNDGTRCSDFEELMEYLQKEGTRRNSEYRIVQLHYDQPTVAPRHGQYDAACYFFAIAPIIEYLGYSRFTQGNHLTYLFNYPTIIGLGYHRCDAGYYLSAEDLMAKSVHWETLLNQCEYDFTHGWECEPFSRDGFYSDAAKTDINATDTRSCSGRFDVGEEYGWCSNRADTYEAWLNYVDNGCGRRCHCRQNASCGMYWFANYVLNIRDAGCNDMKRFRPDSTSYSDRLHMRKVVKGFIDHNLPLLIAVRQGGHFMILIGYTDLDSTGYPRKAIIVDSGEGYKFASLVDNWDEHEDSSISELIPWNQHLDNGCESGGWADQIDGHSSDFKLCTMPDGWTSNCVENRIYGAQITCEDNGSIRSRYFTHDNDLFVSDSNQISCDKVKLRYSDGEHAIESVKIQRYRYSPTTDEWYRIGTYYPDVLSTQIPHNGRPGPLNVVEWDAVWPDNYWMIAHGLGGTYTKRRSTIEMTFDDGAVKKIELSPPDTYGVTVDCIDNGRIRSSYSYEADHGVFRVAGEDFTDKQFLYEYYDKSCDEVVVRVNLGEEAGDVVDATIQRMYYTTSNSEWLPLQSAWYPDNNQSVPDGLTGCTRIFTWDDVWPENYWLVGENVGSDHDEDRKTIIRLLDGSLNLLREIEIVPY